MTIGSNVNQIFCRVQPSNFGIHFNPKYDILFGLMKSGVELSSNNNEKGSSEEALGNDFDSESLHTDDFSSSTSTELKTTTNSSSPSSELKASSGSTENDNDSNHDKESESPSDDCKPHSRDEIKPASYTATETESTYLNDESKTTMEDRKPPSNPSDQHQDEETAAQTSPRSEHIIHTELNQANKNHESFPYTLRRMLNAETEEASIKSIQWLKGGDGFEVVDQNTFETHILPKYFPTSCLFQSFVRKLYRYVFLIQRLVVFIDNKLNPPKCWNVIGGASFRLVRRSQVIMSFPTR